MRKLWRLKKKRLANLHQRKGGNQPMWVAKEKTQRQWTEDAKNDFVFHNLMKKKAMV
jgi:hypothetical protein